MKFDANVRKDLPRLAWSAMVQEGNVKVEHGVDVEVGDGWVVEGVWDAPFEGGQFDRSAGFWGSGLTVRGDSVTVVPSIALCDRLLMMREGAGWRVSNSLPLLLGRSLVSLDENTDYRRAAYAIAWGVVEYDKIMPVSGGREVLQVFHRIAKIEAGGVSFHDRPPAPQHTDFASYLRRIRGVVERLQENFEAPSRTKRIKAVATASSGYDSACTAVFAKAAGAALCATSSDSNRTRVAKLLSPGESDSGGPVASALGLAIHDLPALPSNREIRFRSASCTRPELAFDGLYGLFENEVGAVFTGFYGDTIWGIPEKGSVDSELRWHEPSGVSLSEARLHAGYINLALPFLDGRGRPYVVEVSKSEEMNVYRIGGDYDRPIPRRILEEAGVPREAFGRRKRAILNLDDIPANPSSREDFLAWLDERGRVSSSEYLRRLRLSSASFYANGFFDKVVSSLGGRPRYTKRDSWWTEECHPQNLMFLWANDRLAAGYRE